MKQNRFRLWILVLAIALGACTTGGGNAPFALSLEPASPAVPPGGQAQATVKITRNTGFTGAVQLGVEGLPAG